MQVPIITGNIVFVRKSHGPRNAIPLQSALLQTSTTKSNGHAWKKGRENDYPWLQANIGNLWFLLSMAKKYDPHQLFGTQIYNSRTIFHSKFTRRLYICLLDVSSIIIFFPKKLFDILIYKIKFYQTYNAYKTSKKRFLSPSKKKFSIYTWMTNISWFAQTKSRAF